MMKFIFGVIFMHLMWFSENKMFMFYYNLCYFFSVMFMGMYMFKNESLSINLGLGVSVNYYSFFLILLSMWVLGLMFMSLEYCSDICIKLFIFIFMLMILMLFFMSSNLLYFYFFFEVSLVPTFFLIIYWGYNLERLSASYYLMMYTLLISLPLLFYVFKMFNLFGSFSFDIIMMNFNLGEIFGSWDYLIIFSAFLIKLPIYSCHLWLPKAHVEAPVYGSMVLAAILLKLGSFGLLRLLMIFCSQEMILKFCMIMFSIGLMGGILTGVLCLSQIDMKSLVAYSSVVHMNLLMCSMLTMLKMGILSSLIMMISHGLCSSGLFYMVNLYYLRSSSRLFLLNKGVVNLIPSYSIWWFLLCASNFSFPFSLNFISEIFMISVILSWEVSLIIYLILFCFFSSAYSLYLYSYIQHGGEKSSYVSIMKGMKMSMIKEFLILILHIYPLGMMLLNLIIFS